MKKIPSILLQLLITFSFSVLFFTACFILLLSSPSDSITLKVIAKIIKDYALIVCIPTSIIFVILNIPISKIETKWFLWLTRCVVFLGTMFLVWLFLSITLIPLALLDNPFKA